MTTDHATGAETRTESGTATGAATGNTTGTGRRGVRALWVAVPLGLVVSGALVYQASFAAFTATTTNPDNTFSSGTVVLSDDRSGTALFTTASEGKLVPGSTGHQCIDVTYAGDVAAQVRLHTAYGATSDLAPYLQVQVDEVDAGAACSPSGDLTGDGALFGTPTDTAAGLVSGHGAYASGLGSWAATGTGTETRRYRISYVLADDDAAQGKQVELALTWEARTS